MDSPLGTLLILFLIVGGYTIPMGIAIARLRRLRATDTQRSLWTLAFVALPVVGPLAFLWVTRNDPTQ